MCVWLCVFFGRVWWTWTSTSLCMLWNVHIMQSMCACVFAICLCILPLITLILFGPLFVNTKYAFFCSWACEWCLRAWAQPSCPHCVPMWQYTLYKRNHVPSSSSSSPPLSSLLRRERVGRAVPCRAVLGRNGRAEWAIELTPANSLHLLHFHHRLLCFASQRNGRKIATTINNDSFVNHLPQFWMSQVSPKDFHHHKNKIGIHRYTKHMNWRANKSVCKRVSLCVCLYKSLSFMLGPLKPGQQFNIGLLQMLHGIPPTPILDSTNTNSNKK